MPSDIKWVARHKNGDEIEYQSEAEAKAERPKGYYWGLIVNKTGEFFRRGPRWYPERRDYRMEHATQNLRLALTELSRSHSK